MKKRHLLLLVLPLMISACGMFTSESNSTNTPTSISNPYVSIDNPFSSNSNEESISQIPSLEPSIESSANPSVIPSVGPSVDKNDKDTFFLVDDNISYYGTGATISNKVATITRGGSYRVTGSISDGQIVINSVDTEDVILVLDNAIITSLRSAPIYVKQAQNTIIYLNENTENYLSDTVNLVYDDAVNLEPRATIFSKDDLYFNGSGKLTVNAAFNNGIQSKDDIGIYGGNINITSANHGIIGKDSVEIQNATLNINAAKDGIQSSENIDTTKGYVLIDNSNIAITAAKDGIQAESGLTINSGNFTITTGGGSVNSSYNNNGSTTSESMKGLKCSSDINLYGGTIVIDSADDGVHSNGTLTISNVTLNVSSGNDGIHADKLITINSGNITVNKSYEGIESEDITINGGVIKVNATDDGINAAGGDGSPSTSTRPGGGNPNYSTLSGLITINDGLVYVNSTGDGLDVNGSINMTGGTVIVEGPTNSGNGALDYDGTFKITGGLLIAVGSSGMAQAPSTSSTQRSVMINFTSQITANSIINIQRSNGTEIVSFLVSKNISSFVISSSALVNESGYVVYRGGSHSGTLNNGLYTGGSYTPGNQYTTFSISSMVTTIGSGGGRW